MSTSPTIAREPIKVIADVLQRELELQPNQVMLGYEKFNIPESNLGLYIDLVYLGGKVISNANYSVDSGESMDEVQEALMLHTIQIDLLSFDASARVRKEEIAMALGSIYAQSQMDQHSMQISRQPTPFVDAASLEETKMLNRFTTTILVTALHRKVKAAPFFDSFPAALLTGQDNVKFTPMPAPEA